MRDAHSLRYRGNPAVWASKSARPMLRIAFGPAEKRDMKNPFFQLGAAFAGLVFLSIFALEGKTIGQSMGLIGAEDDPVLVFMIPNPDSLASVRAAIDDERVLWEGDEGFALVGARVYVKDLTEAGGLIAIGGWVEKPVQIVGLGMDSGTGDDDSPTPAMSREQRMIQLRKLVNKPSLTRVEQVFVLSAMNDGLEI